MPALFSQVQRVAAVGDGGIQMTTGYSASSLTLRGGARAEAHQAEFPGSPDAEATGKANAMLRQWLEGPTRHLKV